MAEAGRRLSQIASVNCIERQPVKDEPEFKRRTRMLERINRHAITPGRHRMCSKQRQPTGSVPRSTRAACALVSPPAMLLPAWLAG